jgi:hypothetical protein
LFARLGFRSAARTSTFSRFAERIGGTRGRFSSQRIRFVRSTVGIDHALAGTNARSIAGTVAATATAPSSSSPSSSLPIPFIGNFGRGRVHGRFGVDVGGALAVPLYGLVVIVTRPGKVAVVENGIFLAFAPEQLLVGFAQRSFVTRWQFVRFATFMARGGCIAIRSFRIAPSSAAPTSSPASAKTVSLPTFRVILLLPRGYTCCGSRITSHVDFRRWFGFARSPIPTAPAIPSTLFVAPCVSPLVPPHGALLVTPHGALLVTPLVAPLSGSCRHAARWCRRRR